MKTGSLRFRISIAAALSIISALTLSGFCLALLFERHVVRHSDSELSVHLKQLAATFRLTVAGEPILEQPLADKRFQTPLGGLYWLVIEESRPVLYSRSLWDQTLKLPAGPLGPGILSRDEIVGPNDTLVIVLHRTVILNGPSGDRQFRLAVAIEKEEITRTIQAFVTELVVSLGLVAAVLLAAAWTQIAVGLKPLDQLRRGLNDIRTGEHPRLDGRFPSEVQLLVDELNALLDARDDTVQRARARAGDLAHGLKTPLAILTVEGRALREAGQDESAEEIEIQVGAITRHVERELARTRARGLGGTLAANTRIKPAISRLVAVMRRLPRGGNLNWITSVPKDLSLDLDPQDFDDVIGNLLDNARKWARSKVEFLCQETADEILLVVEDDGVGVPDERIISMLKRGGRLDESKPGAGLGLSIVRDILDVYGADLVIENLEKSGLRATIHLPKSN